MKYTRLILTLFISVLAASCTTVTENINPDRDKEIAVRGLNYKDFQKAANEAIDSILRSGAFNSSTGKRLVLVISDIKNDTMQNIDTSQLVKKIRVALLQSGKVFVTTAIGAKGAEDKMSMRLRKLRNHQEFNQKTVVAKNQLSSADLSLSGKIIQKNIRIDRNREQSEYYFQLTLTDVVRGLAVWEGETFIGKRGSGDSVSW